MPKSRKQVMYSYQTDAIELNKRFYQRYDENLLFNKALAIACILEDTERFKSFTTTYPDIEPSRINDKFFETIRAELHFTEMHQFEGFFALLIAMFKDLPHWIYLTAYHTSEIADAIHQFIGRDIAALTDEIAKNDREFVSRAVYSNYQPQEEAQKDVWNENLDNIAWLIRHMAEKYVASKDEYNSYKHGVRVMTGEFSLSLRRQDEAGNPIGPNIIMAHSEDSFNYLELEDNIGQTIQDSITKQTIKVLTPKKEKNESKLNQEWNVIEEIEVKRAYEVSKHFNPKQSMYHLKVMNRLLATIKKSRLAYYTDKGQLEQLATFFDLDRGEIVALREKYFKWSMSI